MRLAYVATPYSAVIQYHKRIDPNMDDSALTMAKVEAKAIAIAACRKVYDEYNYTPVSPILMLWGVFDEIARPDERAIVMEACYSVLKTCQAFVWTDCKYSPFSVGMTLEQSMASKLCLPRYSVIINLDEDERREI